MSPTQSHQTTTTTTSSGSEVDQRKRKRMISNRESARRSRMRKQQHLDGLINQVTQLQSENSQISMQINMLTQQFLAVEGQNTVLRTQVMELTERLRSLNSVLRFVEEFSGMAMDIPEMPDSLVNPWQLPCLTLPIMASANRTQF